jgi:hypothetical protein
MSTNATDDRRTETDSVTIELSRGDAHLLLGILQGEKATAETPDAAARYAAVGGRVKHALTDEQEADR